MRSHMDMMALFQRLGRMWESITIQEWVSSRSKTNKRVVMTKNTYHRCQSYHKLVQQGNLAQSESVRTTPSRSPRTLPLATTQDERRHELPRRTLQDEE